MGAFTCLSSPFSFFLLFFFLLYFFSLFLRLITFKCIYNKRGSFDSGIDDRGEHLLNDGGYGKGRLDKEEHVYMKTNTIKRPKEDRNWTSVSWRYRNRHRSVPHKNVDKVGKEICSKNVCRWMSNSNGSRNEAPESKQKRFNTTILLTSFRYCEGLIKMR